MLIYWEHGSGGVQEANSNTEEDNETCEIQKPQMKNDEDKKQITDPTMNTIFIFDLHMSNNYNNAGFGIQRSKDDMSGVSIESARIFVRSLRIFTQP